MTAKLPEDITSLTFEAAMSELETIVTKLERGDVPLAESIAIYERAELLKAHCDAQLKVAETKVEQIRMRRDGTAESTAPFEAQ